MRNLFDEYRWSIIGGGAGFVLAVLFLTLGFFKTLLILLLTLAGMYGGLLAKQTGWVDRFFHRNY